MELQAALDRLARDPHADVDPARVALLIARDEHPRLDVEAYLSELSGMAHEVRHRLRGSLECRVESLARYLFHEMGFRGNERDYYDPANSYLNQVLDRRRGIPITLSVVAIAVGQRAGMQIVGVGLPGHFVAKAVAGRQEVIFDPFHGGRRLDREECERLVERVTGSTFRATAAALGAASLRSVVQRMLSNLKAIYLGRRDYVRASRVIRCLCRLNPADAGEQRDLGISLLEAGRPGQAIRPLEHYLAARPQAADAPAVQRLLARARGELARWN